MLRNFRKILNKDMTKYFFFFSLTRNVALFVMNKEWLLLILDSDIVMRLVVIVASFIEVYRLKIFKNSRNRNRISVLF